MATPTQTKNTEQSQQPQGQAMVRGSQGLTPFYFFRMNPFSLMRRMSEEFDRAIGEANGRDQGDRAWAPAIEVTQRDGNYVVRAELPVEAGGRFI